MTIHNEAKREEIASKVLMPGDPLRAKFIAETYLDDYKLVNKVRGMLAYTGTYKGTEITVMASGMGIPSMGIYAYELFKFYDVKEIIRIGSAGAYDENLNLFDVILAKEIYSMSNFALALNNEDCHQVKSSLALNEKIINQAKEKDINLVVGKTNCTEAFEAYMADSLKYLEKLPNDLIATEMEGFALLYVAKILGKDASCLFTVTDSKYKGIASSMDREKALTKMIELALEAIK